MSLHIRADEKKFQFTHPGRGATQGCGVCVTAPKVSIHAPREGCDPIRRYSPPPQSFQFTHPGRGATSTDLGVSSFYIVSIHAPREGCDMARLLFLQGQEQFQFTHPGRGATLMPINLSH